MSSSTIVPVSVFCVALTTAFVALLIVKSIDSVNSPIESSTTVNVIAGAVVDPAGISTLTPLSKKF